MFDLLGPRVDVDAILERNWQSSQWPVGRPVPKACNCVGGPNCCIKVAEREREAAIRADERRKVLEEIRAKGGSSDGE